MKKTFEKNKRNIRGIRSYIVINLTYYIRPAGSPPSNETFLFVNTVYISLVFDYTEDLPYSLYYRYNI